MRSPVLIERLTRAALDRVHKANDGRAIDAGELRTNGGISPPCSAAAVLLTMFVAGSSSRPAIDRGAWSRSEAASPFSIAVDPGNATVAKGAMSDRSAAARLPIRRVDFSSAAPTRRQWTRVPMTPDSTGRYAFRLFDIAAKTQYAVEANGVRSTTYTIDVSNLPYVKRMDLQYGIRRTRSSSRSTSIAPATFAALKGRWCEFASRRRCRRPAAA